MKYLFTTRRIIVLIDRYKKMVHSMQPPAMISWLQQPLNSASVTEGWTKANTWLGDRLQPCDDFRNTRRWGSRHFFRISNDANEVPNSMKILRPVWAIRFSIISLRPHENTHENPGAAEEFFSKNNENDGLGTSNGNRTMVRFFFGPSIDRKGIIFYLYFFIELLRRGIDLWRNFV